MVDSSKPKTISHDANARRKKTVIEQEVVGNDLEKETQNCEESLVTIKKQREQNTKNKCKLDIKWIFLPLSGVLGGFVAFCLLIGVQWAGFLSFPFVKHHTDHTGEGKAVQIAESTKDLVEETKKQLEYAFQEINSLKAEFSSLSSQDVETFQDGETLQEENKKAFTALEEKVRNLEEHLQTLSEVSKNVKVALSMGQNNTDDLALLKQQLETVEKEIATRNDDKEKTSTALFIAINSLKNAVERGGSYSNELKIVQQLSPSIEGLDLLQETATVGIPSSVQLSADFANVADAIVGTQNIVEPGVPFWERAWAWVKSLVVLRPVGNVEGMSLGAIAARMEVAIQKGDYEKALSEWQTLPQGAKDVSVDFVRKLEKYIAIHNFLQQLPFFVQQGSFEEKEM
ncbi:COG4223 family protein [Bartonella sp. B30(2025)]